MQPRVETAPVSCLAGRSERESIVQKLQGALPGLFRIFLLQGLRQLQKRFHPSSLAHYEVPEVRAQRRHEVQGVEPLCQYPVKCQQGFPVVACQEIID